MEDMSREVAKITYNLNRTWSTSKVAEVPVVGRNSSTRQASCRYVGWENPHTASSQLTLIGGPTSIIQLRDYTVDGNIYSWRSGHNYVRSV